MTDYTKQLVEQRRELHQWPEEGWTEFWTTRFQYQNDKAEALSPRQI